MDINRGFSPSHWGPPRLSSDLAPEPVSFQRSELPNRVQSRKEEGSDMYIKVLQENEASSAGCLCPDHLKGFSAPPSARNQMLCMEFSRE